MRDHNSPPAQLAKTIHMPASSSQPYVTTACGIEAYVWRQPGDPPGTCSADPQEGEPGSMLFVHGEEYELVDCPACQPAALRAQERRQKFLKEVEEAGGLEEYLLQRRWQIASIAAARSQRAKFKWPETSPDDDLDKDILPKARNVAWATALEEFVLFSNPKHQRSGWTLVEKYPEVAANCAVSECRRVFTSVEWEKWGGQIELAAREAAQQTAHRALKTAGVLDDE